MRWSALLQLSDAIKTANKSGVNHHFYFWISISEEKEIEKKRSHVFEELLGDDASPGVDRQLHLADLLVDLLHEVDDKVHQLVFVHLLRVEVGDQEADVVTLRKKRAERQAQSQRRGTPRLRNIRGTSEELRLDEAQRAVNAPPPASSSG